MNAHPLCDAAWRAIVRARGHVQGKVLVMGADTLRALLRERGRQYDRSATYRLYDVEVRVDNWMHFGAIEMEER